jgi:hypothetical protein
MTNPEFGRRFHDLKYVEVAYISDSLRYITNMRAELQKVLTNVSSM